MLLLNKMNKYNSYKMLNIKYLISGLMCLFSTFAMSSSLTGVKYNTMQNEEIKLTFILSEDLKIQPKVKTSMSPANISLTFEADSFDLQLQETIVEHAGVNNITVQKRSGKVVATIHMDQLSVFDVSQIDNEFSLVLNKGLKNTSVGQLPDIGKDFINNVLSLDFRKGQNNEAQVLVNLEDSMVAVDVSDKLGKLYVEFHNTEISEDLLYQLDVTDFGTLVTNIETFKEGRNARLVIDINGDFTFKHQQLNNLFSLTVAEKIKVPGYLGESDDFSGKAISLNFQDIPVRTVLQIIADYNGFNLVTSDTVAGSITLRLDGVPWDQALDIILKVKGLDKRMEGNILMVAPSDELAAREARDLQALQQVEELAPLYSEYVQVNYAKASELADLVKTEDNSILSERGSVSVDERTNTLLIRDTAKSIEDIKRMVTVLDIPIRQVIIEARMVTVVDSVDEELGIRWGITNTDGEYGSAATIDALDDANGLTQTPVGTGAIPDLADRLNVNLPASSGAASLAFQVARLANGTILDLELSALEQENKGEVIASPRITTSNQKEAYIEQGVEIPYQEAASSGATSVSFKKAVLSLTVTPHITPDDRIILDLIVSQDTRGEETVSGPSINTQRIGTQVLVNNAETIVLGGIYEQSLITSVSKVPVLGDVPYFGWLFRNTSNVSEKKELLIFVTPRIVTERL
ncbi:type IV pilus secretin PilQ family protein [Pseudocolwellia sp. AS88]|uniref:type IV pilus secretin PilQ n=2 Tax=Colwelliaceae TaxID=267889 RepID=UPI0026F32C31|nr:type IV pilus secretin PilQ family protein [Pseudocolwellia sp. AS88]MDO7084032.1 type IV pilus secretin PilQ family protein [Pseudocolwellia sp. AS88]